MRATLVACMVAYMGGRLKSPMFGMHSCHMGGRLMRPMFGMHGCLHGCEIDETYVWHAWLPTWVGACLQH